jgi:peptidoglycan/LPS O-acetylase OafA/YrhL
MRRIPELDGLRGLAAVAVLLAHLGEGRWPLVGWGWTAVNLFFVLSGYLITGIVLREGRAPGFFAAFYARRVLRIWPTYFLTIAAILLVNPLPGRAASTAGLPWYLTFTQNVPRYWGRETPPFHEDFNPAWSVALEEQFYLLWPAVVLLAGPRRVVPVALGLIGLGLAARLAGFSTYLLLAQCDGFAFGGLLAAMVASRPDAPRSRGLIAACLAALAVAATVPLWGRLLVRAIGGAAATNPERGVALIITGADAASFAVVGLAVAYSGSRWLAPLRGAWARRLGEVSYGLYLYHLPIFGNLDAVGLRLGVAPSLPFDAFKAAVALGVAVASWHLIERPILGLKHRFAYRRALAPEAVETTA